MCAYWDFSLFRLDMRSGSKYNTRVFLFMKQLVIIGAGGFGREVHNMAPFCRGYGEEFVIKGFINDITDALDGFEGYAPIIGTIKDYMPREDDVFICAIGDIAGRKKCVNMLLERGAEFINLVHRTAGRDRNTAIGKGCILGIRVGISCDCKIGDFTILQDECLVGHDTVIGDFCQLHPRVFIAGKVSLGDDVHVGPYALVHPGKKVGDGATIGGASFVIRNVKSGSTVYGNPAKLFR